MKLSIDDGDVKFVIKKYRNRVLEESVKFYSKNVALWFVPFEKLVYPNLCEKVVEGIYTNCKKYSLLSALNRKI